MPLSETSDKIQGKVMAVLLWDTGLRPEQVGLRVKLDPVTIRNALEDLLRRRMVTIDQLGFWAKTTLPG